MPNRTSSPLYPGGFSLHAPNLHNWVIQEVGRRIVGGNLKPGDRLPNEAQLCTELNVSRTALREAIKVLAAKRLIASRPKTGTIVLPRDEWNGLDPDILAWSYDVLPIKEFAYSLYEVRLIFEPAAAALAAERATRSDIATIEDAYKAMETSYLAIETNEAPREQFSAADLRFHLAVLAASRNELLMVMGSAIRAALFAFLRISIKDPTAHKHGLPMHRAVLEAIRRRDASRAAREMRKLLQGSRRVIQKLSVPGRSRSTKDGDANSGRRPGRRSESLR